MNATPTTRTVTDADRQAAIVRERRALMPITRAVALEAARLRTEWRAARAWMVTHTHTPADVIPGTDMYNCACETWDGDTPTPLEDLRESLRIARANVAERQRQRGQLLDAWGIINGVLMNQRDPELVAEAGRIVGDLAYRFRVVSS